MLENPVRKTGSGETQYDPDAHEHACLFEESLKRTPQMEVYGTPT